jgi:hypothetical protein
MKQLLFSMLTASVFLLLAASSAWARGVGRIAPRGFGHATFAGRGSATAVGHAVPRDSGAEVGRGYRPSRPVVPYYGFYGPALGWGYAYDPYWYGPGWAYPYEVPPGAVTGGLRLEVTPKTADVYVDGYYAGVVNDFNGHFQHLDLTPGGTTSTCARQASSRWRSTHTSSRITRPTTKED